MICLHTAVLEAVFNAWKVLRAAQMKMTVGWGNDGVSPSAGVSYPPLTSMDPHPFTPAEDLALSPWILVQHVAQWGPDSGQSLWVLQPLHLELSLEIC